MKLKFTFTFLLSILISYSFATHFMGGEITWRCDGTGKFIFVTKLYIDCNGVTEPSNVVLKTNAPVPGDSIICNKIWTTDISPVGIGCPTCNSPNGSPNAAKEVVYESLPIIINGIPPVSGWHFYYENCCRNAAIINLATPSDNITLKSVMYSYGSTTTNPCFDNSPFFTFRPTFSTCIGEENSLNFLVNDPDKDSITYEWAPATGTFSGGAVIYAAGYSYDNALPDTNSPFNSLNIPVTLDKRTGAVKFKSYDAGTFVLCIKITSYKCSKKISEIYRDLQFTVAANCNIGTTGITNKPPIISLTKNNITYTDPIFTDTIMPRDTVRYLISVADTQLLSNGSPQSIRLYASGTELSDDYVNETGNCLVQPCAVIDRQLPFTFTNQNTINFYGAQPVTM